MTHMTPQGVNEIQARIQAIESRIASLQAQFQKPVATAPVSFDTYMAMHGQNSQTPNSNRKLKPAPKAVEAIIAKLSAEHNIDPKLVREVIRAESGFNPKALSKKGAMGLMQLMPGTAKALGVRNPYDIEENITGGVRYLKSLLERFENKIELALAAYNAGPNAVKKFNNQIPPYQETRSFVSRILANLDISQD